MIHRDKAEKWQIDKLNLKHIDDKVLIDELTKRGYKVYEVEVRQRGYDMGDTY